MDTPLYQSDNDPVTVQVHRIEFGEGTERRTVSKITSLRLFFLCS